MSLLIRCLFSVALVMIGLLTLCAWLYLKPPMSLYLVKPKLLYQTFIEPFLIVLLLLQLFMSAMLLTSTNPQIIDSLFFHGAYDLMWLYIFLGFLYCDSIKHATVKGSHDYYFPEIKPAASHYTFTEQEVSLPNLSQPLKLYASKDGPQRETCLVYLSQEPFSIVPLSKHILYLQKLALREGYSFAASNASAFSYEMATALRALSYKRLILVASSKEACSALSAACSNNDLDQENLPCLIDGVIALYPALDTVNTSDYAATIKDIPIFLIHGSHDSQTSCHHSKQFFKLMAANHKNIRYLELPNVEHNFDKVLFSHCSAIDKVVKEVTIWLHTYYYE